MLDCLNTATPHWLASGGGKTRWIYRKQPYIVTLKLAVLRTTWTNRKLLEMWEAIPRAPLEPLSLPRTQFSFGLRLFVYLPSTELEAPQLPHRSAQPPHLCRSSVTELRHFALFFGGWSRSVLLEVFVWTPLLYDGEANGLATPSAGADDWHVTIWIGVCLCRWWDSRL